MDLKTARAKFAGYQASLTIYAQTKYASKGYLFAWDEGRVLPDRRGILKGSTLSDIHSFVDLVHKQNSYHYSGLAADGVAWKLGSDMKWGVVLGSDPIWRDLADYFQALGPACRAGYYFKNPSPDPCHFELAIYG